MDEFLSDPRKPRSRMIAQIEAEGGDSSSTAGSVSSVVHGERNLDAVLPAGTEVESYVIQTQLGTGGLSHVYRATHTGHGRPVAIKVLTHAAARSQVMVKRFFREVRAINSIRHPNIAEIFDVGRLVDGRPFYVMELVEGQTLSRMVRRHGRAPVARACAIVDTVGGALAVAHEAGIVHRDVKPGNILVGDASDPSQTKLIDFGVAKLLRADEGPGLTATGQHLGTPSCMAPEQVRCEAVDHRADIYGLGATLFFLLTGSYPFGRGSLAELEHRILSSTAPRPSELAPVPPALDRVVLRCLEKDPGRRFPSIEALVTALRAAGTDAEAAEGAALVRQVIGVYVEAFAVSGAGGADGADTATDADGDEEDLDDAALDDMDAVIRKARIYLTEFGFLPVLETGTGMLSAFVIREDRAAAQQVRAVAVARNLHDVLALRPERTGEVGVCISVHADTAEVEQTGGRERITGGPITTTTWVAQPPRPGVVLTDAARRVFEGE